MSNIEKKTVLPVSFFENNRKKILDLLPPCADVVVFAGKAPVLSADQDYRFFANRNFYYLTGIEQEESVLVIHKREDNVKETLLIWFNDPHKERWTGKRLTRGEATSLSGICDVRYLPEGEDPVFQELLDAKDAVLAIEENVPFGPARDFERRVVSSKLEKEVFFLSPLFVQLRMRKEPCEIDAIRAAIALTEAAMREMAAEVSPGVSECELTAKFEYALKRRECPQEAFPAIVAGGEHSLCLHHTTPSGNLNDGDILQLDVGGRIDGLCADISRVFPVSGTFTEKQSLIYGIVRECQKTAFSTIRPGILLADINEAVKTTAAEELMKVGLLSSADKISDYYWHNVSHHMGHDVHDVCVRDHPLEEGMVLTVEPGIYIPQWGFGIRIEDDVLITSGGCVNLSESFPREEKEISGWVKGDI